jgi:hypothetical protein
MTTQTAVLAAPTGLTLTAKLFTLATPDTTAFTANSVTERTNAKGQYVATFDESSAISGDHTLILFSGARPVAIGYRTFAGTDGEIATETPEAVELDSATITAIQDGVTLAEEQPDVTFDSVTIETSGSTPNITLAGSGSGDGIAWTRSGSGVPLDTDIVNQIQSGVATSSALGDVQTDVDAANNYLSALSGVFSGITSLANWLRRGFRKDSGTAGMITAQSEINTGGTATFSGLTDSLEAIRDNQQSSGGASLEDIIAGVQSVSGGILAAQDESALYITIGDTWTQDIESLGDLTDKTIVFAIKSKARDADNAAVVLITEGTGLTRLNGAATTASWGSIEILDEAAGDIRLRLESDATSLLTSGTYVDAVKTLEDGDDRTPRQRGKTVVSVGVIADIT